MKKEEVTIDALVVEKRRRMFSERDTEEEAVTEALGNKILECCLTGDYSVSDIKEALEKVKRLIGDVPIVLKK